MTVESEAACWNNGLCYSHNWPGCEILLPTRCAGCWACQDRCARVRMNVCNFSPRRELLRAAQSRLEPPCCDQNWGNIWTWSSHFYIQTFSVRNCHNQRENKLLEVPMLKLVVLCVITQLRHLSAKVWGGVGIWQQPRVLTKYEAQDRFRRGQVGNRTQIRSNVRMSWKMAQIMNFKSPFGVTHGCRW